MRLQSLDTVLGCLTLRQLRGLRTVEFPDGLEAVGEGWLADSAVERVTIPASVREIRRYAFAFCEKLKSV